MKKRSLFTALRPDGILRWSTACILFGTAAGLTSCSREERYVATEKDAEMARAQTRIEELDAQQELLKKGEVANNFSIPGVGYYHAAKHDFYEHPYNFERDGKWFVDGTWQDQLSDRYIEPSRPSPAALKRVDEALAREQQLADGGKAQASHGGGMGMGNMLMMYWLLSGNRGMFSPGNGFRQASQNAGNWQSNVEQQRRDVRRHASANPGYSRMVDQSRAGGPPVRPGSSVRGGFGSSSSNHNSFGG